MSITRVQTIKLNMVHDRNQILSFIQRKKSKASETEITEFMVVSSALLRGQWSDRHCYIRSKVHPQRHCQG